jgi:hypothetical protein
MSLSASRGDREPRAYDHPRSCRETEESGKGFWETEQLDGDLASSWGSCITRQPFLKAETIMRPLRTGKRQRGDS